MRTRSRHRVAASHLLLALCVTGGANAEESADRPTAFEDHVTTSRYLIDVVVVDRKGRPVAGLEAKDFRVRIAGDNRPVRSIDRGDAGWSPPARRASDPGSLPAAGRRDATPSGRWVMLAFDVDRIPARYRQVAIDTARAIVERNSAPGTRFAVVQIRSGETEFLQPFTPLDRMDGRVLERVGRLRGATEELETRVRDLIERIGACDFGTANYTSCINTATSEFTHRIGRETRTGLEALRGLAASMGPLPGRKALVWLSEGFVVQPGALVLEALREVDLEAWELLYNRMSYDESPALEAALAEAGRSRVSVFALRTGRDMGALILGADRPTRSMATAVAYNPFRSAVRMTEASLRTAAEATGGKVLLARLTPSLVDGMFDRLAGTYTLGIEVLGSDPAKAKVQVRVPRGLKARYMKRLPLPSGPNRHLRGALTVEPSDVRSSVRLAIGPDLVGRDPTGVSRVAVYLRAEDAEGDPIHDAYQIVEFDRSTGGTDAGLVYVTDVPPGASRVDVFVTDLIGGRRGSFSAE